MIDASPVFRPLFIQAWNATRRYPWSILFGFVASILGAGSFWELLFNTTQASGNATQIVATVSTWSKEGEFGLLIKGIAQSAVSSPFALLTLLIILGLFAVVTIGVFWLAAISHGALIDTTGKIALGRKTTFRAAWAVGKRFGLRLFSVHILSKVTIALLFLCAGFLFYVTAEIKSFTVSLVTLLILLILLAISLVVTLIVMYAASYIAIRGFSFRESLRAAYQLFFHHWLIALECATAFFLLSIIFGIAVILVMALLALPFILLFITFNLIAWKGALWLTFLVWILLAMIFLATSTALFTTWQISVWTLLFLQLTERQATPKLIRLTHRWFSL